MCELLGVSSNVPTDINDSLAVFRKRGGELGDHIDGWGIAFYEGRSSRIFKEELPAADSQCLEFISQYDFKSEIVVAHIRKATQDIKKCVANTHPFEREFQGRSFVFAHNGELPDIMTHNDFKLKWYFPKGETDSEYTFCFMMDRLRDWFSQSNSFFSKAKLHQISRKIAELGRFNFLFSDSNFLIAYNDHRDDDELYYVLRKCSCGEDDTTQYVAVVVTKPTTDNESWVKMKPDELIMFHQGFILDYSR